METPAQALKDEILRLKKEKGALIMAHYYQREEIQEIASSATRWPWRSRPPGQTRLS